MRISGYNLFLKEHSAKISQADPNMRPYEIMQQVAKLWGASSNDEKELYRMTAECLVSYETSDPEPTSVGEMPAIST